MLTMQQDCRKDHGGNVKAALTLRGVYLAASGTDGVCKVLKNKSLVGKVKVISNDLTTRNEQEFKARTDPVPAWTERICAGIFSGDDFI